MERELTAREYKFLIRLIIIFFIFALAFSTFMHSNLFAIFQPVFSLKLLLNFFDAGIDRITVNPGALIHKDVGSHILEKLINVSVQ